MDRDLKEKLLKNQVNLNYKIMELSESDLIELIRSEQEGMRRAQYITRCYRRLSILRKRREKDLLSAGHMAHLDTILGTSTDEVAALDSLISEQDGQKRAGVLHALYMQFYSARRRREEVQLSELRF